jgi:hypothetical protein
MNTLARPTIPFPFKSHCIINFICYSFSDVATASGPTSLPGRLRVMTRLLGGVIGPDKASALATTFPGISVLQWKRSSATSNLIGAKSMPRTSLMSLLSISR